jgi:hypothetical protein
MKFFTQLFLIAGAAQLRSEGISTGKTAKALYKAKEECKEDVLSTWQSANEDCEAAPKDEGETSQWNTKIDTCSKSWTQILSSMKSDADAIKKGYECRCNKDREEHAERGEGQSKVGHFFSKVWTSTKNAARAVSEKGCSAKVKLWENTVRGATFNSLVESIRTESADNHMMVYTALGEDLEEAKKACLAGDDDNSEACGAGVQKIQEQVKTSCCAMTAKCRSEHETKDEKRDCILATRHCLEEAAEPMSPYVAWFAGHSTEWPEGPSKDLTMKEKLGNAKDKVGGALSSFFKGVKDRILLPDPCAAPEEKAEEKAEEAPEE